MSGLRRALPFVTLVVLNVVMRLPHWLNSAGVHSDAAIVGLQARHILDGELSRFLWGAGYQASFDAFVIAGVFSVLGPTPFALMLAPFLAYLLLVLFVWRVLARRISPWRAAFACLALAFTPQAVNGIALYAPRQWSVTAIAASIWLLDGAANGRRPLRRFVVGGLVATSAVYLDLYALQMFVPVCLFGVMCAVDMPRPPRVALARALALAGGVAVGLALVLVLRTAPGATSDAASLSTEYLGRNWNLLVNLCLPVLLGGLVFVRGVPFAPPPLDLLQAWGPTLLALVMIAVIPLTFVRRIPWSVRRLGLLGLGASLASVVGFLLSWMPKDIWSARYLAPIIWMMPFTLAPLLSLARPRVTVPLLAPYLVGAAIACWLSFPDYVAGAEVRRIFPTAAPERRLAQRLRAEGVEVAAAPYWSSYRLAFLFEEVPPVIPLSEAEDRYRPYRVAFARARVVAYLFASTDVDVTASDVERQLRVEGGDLQRLEVEGYTVVLHRRRP
jgi:Dolichyl-phosphate-mannose-protein mannosyltransferase